MLLKNRFFPVSFSAAVLAVCLAGGRPSLAETLYSPGRSPFVVDIKKLELPYRVNSVFILPGEEITLKVLPDHPENRYSMKASQGETLVAADRTWKWKGPTETGLYTIEVSREGSSESVTINVFVMVPRERVLNGRLNGYLIGEYPSLPLKGLSIYKPPKGFVEVTMDNENVPLSPHFQLKQFLCKQNSDYPKYLVLQEKLLLKLELLLEKANEKGIPADTFSVMSGYRTPVYNKALGNVKYSRHLWGGAADIFIDREPRDGYMDDLNRDGVINFKDAKVLYDLVDNLYGEPFYLPFIGGLGLYRKTGSHGPYIHVDVRGTHTRWGD